MIEKANKTTVSSLERKDIQCAGGSTFFPETSATDQDIHWMQLALKQAEQAAAEGEIPVGAVLVDTKAGDSLLAAAGNSPISRHDPTGHAEILVLRQTAEKKQNYRLPGSTLYVTLEPCIMCMGALIHARVDRLVYGATDPKTGAASSVYNIGSDGKLNHQLLITAGVLEHRCSTLLKTFFRARRKQKKLTSKTNY